LLPPQFQSPHQFNMPLHLPSLLPQLLSLLPQFNIIMLLMLLQPSLFTKRLDLLQLHT
jgi:hypothetical protein